jgi:diaminopimelate decarboxylase
MNYKVKANESKTFDVVETATTQVIKSFTDQKDAKLLLRHLNFGGGFDGWTPSFMLKNVMSTNKNQ